MKFSHAWLQQFVEKSLNANTLAEKLTDAGLEVDSVEPAGAEFSGVVVGQIVEINKHPDADKLNICQVDVGQIEPLTIVCGAGNIYVGMKAPVAMIGAVLPGNFKIKKGKLRGQESFGMMCSEQELGILEQADGLMDLPEDAPIGQDIRHYLELDDHCIEVDLTPNRADCLSVYGIAREVSALSKSGLKSLSVIKHKPHHDITRGIHIQAQEGCKRYFGAVIKGIDTQAKTPLWMQERLRRSGVRSISLAVDITNYVMLLTGQPMHAFDHNKVDGDITVRYAHEGEKITLLDDSEVMLQANTMVIADDKQALAIAGVMGGLSSSVTDETRDLFLESAFFEPIAVAGRARQYGLHTDSSHRFERGVDPELAEQAMHIAIDLILNIAGGELGTITQAVIARPANPVINMSFEKLNRVLGMAFEPDYVRSQLQALGMTIVAENDTHLQVQAPSYRFDIVIQEDLFEEIGRLYGYANIQEKMPSFKATKTKICEHTIPLHRFKSLLVDRGYHEAINYSFIDPKHDAYFFSQQGITLQNPISADLAVMRQSLIPGLLKAFKENVSRQQTRVRLFEAGVCFFPSEQGRQEHAKIGGLAFGTVNPQGWSGAKIVDFYDVKADVQAMCDLAGLAVQWQVCDDCAWLHPGQSAYVVLEGKRIGRVGVIHPEVMKFLQIKAKAPIVYELDLVAISRKALPVFAPISKFPAVTRDIAVTVSADLPAQAIIDTVKSLALDTLRDIHLFDVYQGDNLPQGQKSLAFGVVFQDQTQTLSEAQMTEAMDGIIKTLAEKHQAVLRS